MSTLLDVGDTCGNWEVVEYANGGHSGTVYKVRRKDNPKCIAALKVHCGKSVKASRPQFLAEIAVMREQPIPYDMPEFYEDGTLPDGTPWYAMELVEMLPEDSRSGYPRRMDPSRVRKLFREACYILIRLHGKGYVHCDIKPDCFAYRGDKLVLTDFGCARKLSDAAKTNVRVGTWEFMAPEVRDALCLDTRADIYSFAASLSGLCNSAALRTFGDAIRKGMSNDPNSRPQTAADLLRELESGKDRLAKFKIAAAAIGIVAVSVATTFYGGHWYNRNHQLSTWGNSRDAKSVLKSFENRTNFPVPSERILR